ncbi:MAG TPA: hypothetical protein VJ809_14680 [Pirellulales bacterium]|jgi:hypothetical protein|uniref:hypothetical protein n=1 Tax=Pseudomonas yamanorum TaxID=515393 RepID=UPI002CFC8548|nr:hypothetical protein [Escherichia coli]HJS08910.1 hypothetical protein [Pirellulales bacterium]
MSEQEITTVKGLTAAQIGSPAHRDLLKRYAGEIAPPCVAEALMKTLDPSRAGRCWYVK